MTMLTPSPPRGKPEAPGPSRFVTTFGKTRLGIEVQKDRTVFKSGAELLCPIPHVSDGARDPNAIRLIIMCHTDEKLGGHHTHGITDARLLAASEFVHTWLCAEAKGRTA